MTRSSETGREIPADELATGLRSDAASINSLRRKTPRDVEDAVRYTAAADLIEAQAARIASLEAERARTVEECAKAVEALEAGEIRFGSRDLEDGWQAGYEAAIDDAAEAIRALAPEKGGQADA